MLNSFIKRFVYTGAVQDHIAPAGYFRDVNNMEEYKEKSVFLAGLNDEASAGSAKSISRFSQINRL